MANLPELRQAIDAVDDELLRLLNERARLVKEVGELKARCKQPFYVPDRERQIVERLQDAQRGAVSDRGAAPGLLRDHQRLPVARAAAARRVPRARGDVHAHGGARALRPVGALRAGGDDRRRVRRGRQGAGRIWRGADRELDRGRGQLDARRVHGLAARASPPRSCSQVSHCLLTRSGTLDGIQKVYSHPQALAQCRAWLCANLPRAALIEVASTALAARLAKDDPVAAAVASELAGQLYDLEIAKRKIEDEVRNVTRFLVIGREPAAPTGRDKTSIMLSVKDQPGILFQVLEPLAGGGINLTRIESRPSRQARVGLRVLHRPRRARRAIRRSRRRSRRSARRCEFVKVLGSYPRAELTGEAA